MSKLTPEKRAELLLDAEAYSDNKSLVVSVLAKQLKRAIAALDAAELELAAERRVSSLAYAQARLCPSCGAALECTK